MPSRSTNLKSTMRAPFFSASFSASDEVMCFPCAWCLLVLGTSLKCVFAPLARADADRFVDGRDENLPVPDTAGPRDAHDRFHHVPHDVVLHDDLDPDLWNEVDHVGRPAIDLFLAAGSTEALNLVYSHPLNAHLPQTILHIVELEGLDDGFDLFHVVS